MNEPLREIEGMWEEVAARGQEFAGRRVRLYLLEEPELRTPQRPAPTPEQARLGIMPPAIGQGTYEDIMKTVQAIRQEDAGWDEAVNDLGTAIEEGRATRRKMAEEAE